MRRQIASRTDRSSLCGQTMPKINENTNLKELIAILVDHPAKTPAEVFRRCDALEQLSACGSASLDALPAIMRSLVVQVSVDCVLALRVAAAEAVWKVGGRRDLALPFLAWALKDEYWGVSRKAAEVLAEMGTEAHDTIPDLVNLAERRLNRGPFHYELLSNINNEQSLLTVVAAALGSCGHGTTNVDTARRVLSCIIDCEDRDASAAALHALKQLQDMRT